MECICIHVANVDFTRTESYLGFDFFLPTRDHMVAMWYDLTFVDVFWYQPALHGLQKLANDHVELAWWHVVPFSLGVDECKV